MMLQAHLITFNVSFSYQDALTHIKERKKNKTCCPNFKVILIDLDSGGLVSSKKRPRPIFAPR